MKRPATVPISLFTSPDSCAGPPEALSADHLERIKSAYAEFLNRAAQSLQSYLGVTVEARFSGAELRPLAEALEEHRKDGCILSLAAQQFDGAIYLSSSAALVSAVLKSMLGAQAEPAQSRSSLSDLDLRLLDGINARMAEQLGNALESMFGWSLAPAILISREKIKNDGRPMLVLDAEINVHESSATLQVAIPTALARLAGGPGSDAPQDARLNRAALIGAIGSATVEVEVLLSGSHIKVRDVLALKPGSALELPYAIQTPVQCRLNGVVQLEGELISSAGSLGFQVHSRSASQS